VLWSGGGDGKVGKVLKGFRKGEKTGVTKIKLFFWQDQPFAHSLLPTLL
jgi:hypothetical protein